MNKPVIWPDPGRPRIVRRAEAVVSRTPRSSRRHRKALARVARFLRRHGW